MSSNICHGNQNGLKWTRHDRNERKTNSRSLQREMCENSKINSKISLSQKCQQIQSVELFKLKKKISKLRVYRNEPRRNIEDWKGKKMVRIQDRNDTLREEVTETTFQRTRTIERTPNRSDSEDSDAEVLPQVEWHSMNRQIWTNTENSGQSTSTAETAQPSIVSFWELMGSKRSDDRRSVIELEANSIMQSPKSPRQNTSGEETKTGQIVQSRIEGSEKKRSPTEEEPRSKQQKTVTRDEDGDSESAEEHDVKDQGPRDQEIEDSWLVDKFQNSPSIVTSKDTKTGGGINLEGEKINQTERDRSYITREAIRASPQRKNRGNQKLPKQQQKNPKSGIQAMKKSTLSRLLLRKHQ